MYQPWCVGGGMENIVRYTWISWRALASSQHQLHPYMREKALLLNSMHSHYLCIFSFKEVRILLLLQVQGARRKTHPDQMQSYTGSTQYSKLPSKQDMVVSVRRQFPIYWYLWLTFPKCQQSRVKQGIGWMHSCSICRALSWIISILTLVMH